MVDSARTQQGAAPSVEPSSAFIPEQRSAVVLSVMADVGGMRAQCDLRREEAIHIGSCVCADCDVDLRVQGRPGAWFSAEVRALGDHWRMSNASPDFDLWVTDLEDEEQRIRIRPGRIDTVVPFEFARLQFAGTTHQVSDPVTAIGYEARHRVAEPCRESVTALIAAGLNPHARYAIVLTHLCELAHHSGLVPATEDVVTRLVARGCPITKRAVDHHIDYLFARLFPDAADGAAPASWKREALIAVGRRARLIGSNANSGSVRPRRR